MDFGLAEGYTDAENGTLPLRPDPEGDENGAVLELSAVANFFVSGVQDHVGTASQRTPPFFFANTDRALFVGVFFGKNTFPVALLLKAQRIQRHFSFPI